MWWTSFSLTAAGQSRILTGFPFEPRAEARDTSTIDTLDKTAASVKGRGRWSVISEAHQSLLFRPAA